MFTSYSVQYEEVTIASRLQYEFARLAVEVRIHQHRRLGGIPVMRVVWRCLKIPDKLPCIDVDRNQRAGIKVVAFAAALRSVRGRGIPSPQDIEVSFRIVRPGDPRLAASMD